MKQAIKHREALRLEPHTTAYRLVNAESDRLPGLIVDRYGNYLVIQCLTKGIDRRKTLLVNLLMRLLNPAGIMERSDVSVRKKEGLTKSVAFLAGERPPEDLVVYENDLLLLADTYHGHKTGLYLDQRENRAIVCQKTFVANRNILNLFAYTGGFAINAAANGASSITNVESSSRLLTSIKDIMALNNFQRPSDEYIKGDVFKVLRDFRDSGRRFDVAIIDPPKMAKSQRDVPAACRGYKDLNLLALQLLQKGGLLATFSCSGLISRELFQKLIFGAAVDAGRNVQIIQNLGQAADHPILVTFPESEYLKGFLCRVN